uniref:Protein farnesyltransferase subunit beta n=1 Tax=Angiostrongylus cantonensis TaxID=6313 RepID=A0A0K0CYL3_ANGCA
MPEVVQNGKVPPAPPPPPEKPRRADGRRRAMRKVDELHPAVEPSAGVTRPISDVFQYYYGTKFMKAVKELSYFSLDVPLLLSSLELNIPSPC